MTRQREPKWLRARRAGAAGDWLARALGRAGAVPGGRVDTAIFSGRISVDGVVVREPFAPVPAGARVTMDGEPLSLAFRTLVVAFHKPRGLVVAQEPGADGRAPGGAAARGPRTVAACARHARG